MGRILWGLLTEAESLVKKCNNLSVLYFILYSFFQHQIKVNFVKVFWSSWFPFDHHCCWQAIFQKLQNYCQILWKLRKEQTGKKKHGRTKGYLNKFFNEKLFFFIDSCGQWIKLKGKKELCMVRESFSMSSHWGFCKLWSGTESLAFKNKS